MSKQPVPGMKSIAVDAAFSAKRVGELVKLEKLLRNFQGGFSQFKREVNRLGAQTQAERLEDVRSSWDFLLNPRAELDQFEKELPGKAVSAHVDRGALIGEQWLKELLQPARQLEAQVLKLTQQSLPDLQELSQQLHFELKRKAVDLGIKMDKELRYLTLSTEEIQRWFER